MWGGAAGSPGAAGYTSERLLRYTSERLLEATGQRNLCEEPVEGEQAGPAYVPAQ